MGLRLIILGVMQDKGLLTISMGTKQRVFIEFIGLLELVCAAVSVMSNIKEPE